MTSVVTASVSIVVPGHLTSLIGAMQDQAQGDAHKEGFMELSKIATRHISRSVFADQVKPGPAARCRGPELAYDGMCLAEVAHKNHQILQLCAFSNTKAVMQA